MFSNSQIKNYFYYNQNSLIAKKILKLIISIYSFIYISNILLVSSTSIVDFDVNNNNKNVNKLALKTNLLRFKRQQSSQSIGNDLTVPNLANSNAGNSNLSPRGTGDPTLTNQDGINSNSDEKQTEEVLSSLKCDFGTSDSPDLCKFKILDLNSNNPLSKSSTTWSLGSGKLALYQGGPLIDASDRNDTTGGYIFYETSNPYIGVPASSSSLPLNQSNFLSSAHNAYENSHSINNNNHHQFNNNNNNNNNDPYSTITTAAFFKTTTHRNSNTNEHQSGGLDNNGNNFQRLTSNRIAINSNSPGPAFISPNLTAPGPSGMCLSFKYAIQGLSAEELKIHVNDHKTERSRQIWSSTESANSNWTRGEVLYSVTNVHSLMFSASSPTSTSSLPTSSIIKDLQQKKFRGYLAIDEIEINKHEAASASGDNVPCKGHCNFDGDLCGWTNAENGPGQDGGDDFDWSFGRGSENLFTGPARDYISSTNNDLTGSYLQIDSNYPRRPGDKAILISPMFQPTATNDAMCMRFSVHMFGSGIGSLAIKIRYSDSELALAQPQTSTNNINQPGGNNNIIVSSNSGSGAGGQSGKSNDLIIWEMSGDAGNNWHQAQTSVSSSRSSFQVLIEGIIGENHLGNIAIDEISFSSGPCPTSPPIASKNYGDCTFEQSMCYWRNPDSEIHLDDLDWIKTTDEQSIHGPNFDHTLKKRFGSYLKLENTLKEPKSGSRAFLLSPIFQPKAVGNVQCLSFYYYMFMRSISSSGPNLGTIRVYLASNNELIPIWRLTNPISSPSWKHARASLSTALIDGQPQAPTKLFQIAFEGIWGDSSGGSIALDDITVFDGACDILPAEAKSVPGECTFDVDMCSWLNKTNELTLMSSSSLSLDNGLDGSTDTSKSPFLQSVSLAPSSNGAGGSSTNQGMSPTKLTIPNLINNNLIMRRPMSWQLATVDSRPVNLQDHTYKAPIGYVYIDVLENGQTINSKQQQQLQKQLSYVLQSFEATVQSGQQLVVQCLSFWFAAFGRQDSNQLSVYLTQASAPPPASSDDETNNKQPTLTSSGSNQPSATIGASPTSTSSADNSDNNSSEQANAWKLFDGKLLWNMSLKNITEFNRRKWLYGQTTLRADSNYIVRFVAQSSDGGFALDDISYYEGACETRPANAKVLSSEEEESNININNNNNNNNNNNQLPNNSGQANSGSANTGGASSTNSLPSSQGIQPKS